MPATHNSPQQKISLYFQICTVMHESLKIVSKYVFWLTTGCCFQLDVGFTLIKYN